MSVSHLEAYLEARDWAASVTAFVSEKAMLGELAAASERLAVWANQIHALDVGNPALSFIQEMHTAANTVPTLLSLSLYKPAAASMRSMAETAIYYTYFRQHPAELATLVRDESWYTSKRDIIDYHKTHTVNFKAAQSSIGMIALLEPWYSKVSAIVHGQIPGSWTQASGGHVFSRSLATQAVETFVEAEKVVHFLFLCTIAQGNWASIAPSAKMRLVKGLNPKQREALRLDKA